MGGLEASTSESNVRTAQNAGPTGEFTGSGAIWSAFQAPIAWRGAAAARTDPRGCPVKNRSGASATLTTGRALPSPGRAMHEGDGAKILVVEDNEQLLALLRRALVREGYEVIAAPSGIELMKLVYSSRPDLIVLDVGLPGVDGRDLLASLKKDPKTFSIPVIVWSGRDPDTTRRVVLDLGAEDYVEKGPPSTLVPKIERVLLRISEGALAMARASIPTKA